MTAVMQMTTMVVQGAVRVTGCEAVVVPTSAEPKSRWSVDVKAVAAAEAGTMPITAAAAAEATAVRIERDMRGSSRYVCALILPLPLRSISPPDQTGQPQFWGPGRGPDGLPTQLPHGARPGTTARSPSAAGALVTSCPS